MVSYKKRRFYGLRIHLLNSDDYSCGIHILMAQLACAPVSMMGASSSKGCCLIMFGLLLPVAHVAAQSELRSTPGLLGAPQGQVPPGAHPNVGQELLKVRQELSNLFGCVDGPSCVPGAHKTL